MNNPDIFDRAARRRVRDRAAPGYVQFDFLRQAMIEGLSERLGTVRRTFRDVLDLGSFDGSFPFPSDTRVARLDAGFAFARRSGGVQADEDRLPFADHSFDLIVSAGVLDSVNDVPGALVLARRILRPDGLFLGAFLGGGTLAILRTLLREAEPTAAAPRMHPQIDVRAAGDLLTRAGFALPVADRETIDVRYASLTRLLADVRGMAGGNVLAGRRPLSREVVGRLATAFGQRADADGRVTERFETIFLTGWAPSPDQPKPAARGSATQSLGDALRSRA